MTRTLALAFALAVSACNNDAGGGTGDAAAPEPLAQSTSVPLSNVSSTPEPVGTATIGMPLGVPLGPLLDEDYHSPERMGCHSMFTGREGMYLSAIDGELMVRSPAGRKLCPITDAQLQSLGQPGGEVSCGGVRMSIRETGERVTSIESDSSSAPAILSATQDGVTRTLDGDWVTAC